MNALTIDCTLATTADAPAITLMMQRFYSEESLVYTPRTAEAFHRLLAAPQLGKVVVVHRHAAIVGYFLLTFFFSVERGGQAALLDELYIEPHARNQGLGTAALEAAAALARSAGCPSLHLEVDHANAAAQRLYQRLGFISQDRAFLSLIL